MSADAATVAVYDARADDYAAMAPGAVEDGLLSRFVAALDRGAPVLDLGCGPGRAAVAMHAAGLAVEATDASAEMVRLARAAGVNARQARFSDLDAQAAYAGIWASFSLLHAPRRDFPGLLDALHRALKPGGLLFLGMKLGTGEKRDALGRRYAYYGAEELDRLLRDAGFAPQPPDLWTGAGLAGGTDPCIGIFAHG